MVRAGLSSMSVLRDVRGHGRARVSGGRHGALPGWWRPSRKLVTDTQEKLSRRRHMTHKPAGRPHQYSGILRSNYSGGDQDISNGNDVLHRVL